MNNSQVSQRNNSKIRRGLVLEGGGAKGAWQFGALQALDEAGIKFDYVAGTSVGALNGALWASGRIDLGKELWGSLSTSKVFKLRIHHSPMFVIGLFARIFYVYVIGLISPDKAPPSLRIILYGLMSLPTFVAAVFLIVFLILFFSAAATNTGLGHTLFTTAALVFLLTVAVLMLKAAERTKHFFFMSLVAWVALLLNLLDYVSDSPDIEVKNGLYLSFIIEDAMRAMPIFLWLLGVMPFVIFCIAMCLRHLNTSIFSVAPLEVIIKDLLAGGFKMPMFATVAREIHEYYDPDDLQYRKHLNQHYNIAVPHSTIIPSYVRVDSLSPENALSALLATSALPLGITPRRTGKYAVNPRELNALQEAEAEEFSTELPISSSFGKGYKAPKVSLIDGGVADNIPWVQFIEDVPCDEIVIIGCNPVSDWDDSERKREWKLKNRLLRVVESCLQGESSVRRERLGSPKDIKNDPPTVVPLREPDHWPERVVIIAPDAPLGNFLTGTLNFSTGVARKRLKEGYKKASKIIEEEFNSSR